MREIGEASGEGSDMGTGYLLFKGRVRRAGGIAAEKKCRVLPSESGMGRELKQRKVLSILLYSIRLSYSSV